MHILIFGASGHVGTGLAEHLAPAHRITGVVRKQPEGPTPYAPLILPDWVDRPESVVTELQRTRAPRVDAVIAAIGGWYVDGTMIGRGIGSFDDDFGSYLRGHFAACSASESLAEVGAEDGSADDADGAESTESAESADGTESAESADGPDAGHERSGSTRLRHLALNGVASVEACVGSGAISVFGAAQEMLVRVAAAESESESVDFRELKVMAPIGGDERNDLSGGVETVSLARVADTVAGLLSRPVDDEISSQLHALA